MLENNQKGWHGSFSRAGKNSAEQFTSIINKDEIFKRAYKTIKIHDMFTPDKDALENKLEYLKDDIKLCQIYETELLKEKKLSKNSKKQTKKTKVELINKNISQNDRFKYRNIHLVNEFSKKHQEFLSPACTKYNPRFSLIFPKLTPAPNWDLYQGRIKDWLSTSYDNKNNNNIKDRNIFTLKNKNKTKSDFSSKCLIDMNKVSQRGDFLDLVDTRLRSDKPFIFHKNKKRKKAKTEINKQILFGNKSITNNNSNEFYSIQQNKKNFIIDINNSNNSLTSPKFSTLYKNKTVSSINSFSMKNNNNDNNSKKNLKMSLSEQKFNAIDFNKNLSREKVNKLHSIQNLTSMIPFIIPNYYSNHERDKCLIKYKNEKPKQKSFKGINSNLYFDLDKIYGKYNNHKVSKGFDFNLMPKRYKSNKKISDDKSKNIIRKEFNICYSSFFPKKSFNNLINLNILNSSLMKGMKNNEEIKNQMNMIKNEISFNYKSYKELIGEGALNKFDNITLKTNDNSGKIVCLLNGIRKQKEEMHKKKYSK